MHFVRLWEAAPSEARGGRYRRGSAAIAAVYCALALAACSGAPAGNLPDDVLRPGEARAGRAPAGVLARDGERVYGQYCIGCHGEKGDGQGPAARFLNPKPRDFTQGVVKYAGVASGQLPRDEDLMRTLARGLAGSSMPSWQFLPEQSRRAVIEYIKTFYPGWRERTAGSPIAISDDPYGTSDPAAVRKAVERGRVVYHVLATCWQCHASYATQADVNAMAAAEGEKSGVALRPDAAVPAVVDDMWGYQIRAPDFPRQRLKGGSSLADLYRTVASGIGGTAMPTWKGALEENDMWALAYYVKSLADRRWLEPRAIPSPPPASLGGGAAANAPEGK